MGITATETDLVKTCLGYLDIKGIDAWRNNSGAVVVPGSPGRKRRCIRYGKKGSSDILGMVPDGRFLAVECKRKGKYPTKEQRAFLAMVKRNNGIALLVRDVDDLIRGLEDHGC